MPPTATPTSNGIPVDSTDRTDHLGVPTIDLNGGELSRTRIPVARAVVPREGYRFLSGIGRTLRFAVGVDESLMDEVQWERASYAAFGGVVVLTSVIAAFSMWFASQQSAGAGVAGALIPAVIWMLFVFSLDRLIVTTRPAGAWHRWVMFVGRGLIATLLGIVIAEPLVLRIFQTQIEAQVRSNRAEHLAQLETSLERCNPDPSDPNAAKPGSECTSRFRLSLTVNPAPQAAEVGTLRQQAADLTALIAKETEEIKRLDQVAAEECNGTSGSGLSGRPGVGINCRIRRESARQYKDSVPLAAQQQQLSDLNARIVELQGGTTLARTAYAAERAKQINDRLAKETAVDAPIGLLERMEALGQLGGSNMTLAAGIWFVRLLFIAVDCAPVLMKMTSGRSRYDELVGTLLDDAVKTHRIRLEGKDTERAMEAEEHQRRLRDHAIVMQQRQAEAVDARAAAYERQAREEQRPGYAE